MEQTNVRNEQHRKARLQPRNGAQSTDDAARQGLRLFNGRITRISGVAHWVGLVDLR